MDEWREAEAFADYQGEGRLDDPPEADEDECQCPEGEMGMCPACQADRKRFHERMRRASR